MAESVRVVDAVSTPPELFKCIQLLIDATAAPRKFAAALELSIIRARGRRRRSCLDIIRGAADGGAVVFPPKPDTLTDVARPALVEGQHDARLRRQHDRG